jgi:uroporphyrinogen decarboxylase
LRDCFTRLLEQPAALRAGWVCGLGHGVLQTTPEANVRLALKIQREMFG